MSELAVSPDRPKSLPPPNGQTHFVWIDILRGVAALAVVLFHVRVDLWVGWTHIQQNPAQYDLLSRATAYLAVPFVFGGSGVMLFFLLSGFCVHYPYAGRPETFAWRPYAIRRSFRIYPPYLLTVLFTLLVEQIGSTWLQQPASSSGKVWESLFMAQNFGAAPGQMQANPSLWSLPVEMELYVVYVLLLPLLRQIGLWGFLALPAAVSLVASLFWGCGSEWLGGHFAPYWLIWCAGATLAEWVKAGTLPQWTPWHRVATLVLFALAAGASARHLPLPLQNHLWAAAYFFVIWWGLSRPGWVFKLAPPILAGLTFLGAISYSLYLVHFPFFRLCGNVWLHWKGSKPAVFLIPLGFALGAVALAFLFHKIAESPSHRLARKWAGKK